jgi:uncharacterized membrane protein
VHPSAPPPPPVTFGRAARRAGTALTLLVVAVGLASVVTGKLVAPIGAPFLALGGLSLLVLGLEVLVDRRRRPKTIPLDPDDLRRSRRP